MMVNHGPLKRASPEPDYQVFRGAPNFIVDVFDSDPLSWNWHAIGNTDDQLLAANDDGVIRSKALPGLWVPETAFQTRDWWMVMASTTRGVTRRGHHQLIDTIWNPK